MAEVDDIVYYLMPDGTKVSNDPRFLAAQAQGLFDEQEDELIGYAAQSVAELKNEVKERNSGRENDDKISLRGIKTKSELIALLEDDDEKHAGSDETTEEDSEEETAEDDSDEDD